MFLTVALSLTGCLTKDDVSDTLLTDTDIGAPGNPGGDDGPGGGPGGPGGPGTDDTGATGPGSTGGEAIDESLLGRTYMVDVAESTFVEPSGLGSLLELAGNTVLLFHISSEGVDSFKMVASVMGDDGQQDPCERIIELSTADWDNPAFSIERSDLELVVNDFPLTVANTLLTGTFRPDASGWDDGVIRGTMDTRELEPILAGDTTQDLCELVELLGSVCGTCDDGSETCFTLDLADVTGESFSGSFDPDAECG